MLVVIGCKSLAEPTQQCRTSEWVGLGEKMNRTAVPEKHADAYFRIARPVLACVILLICCGVSALAQNTSEVPDLAAAHSFRVTHILGFAGAPSNANGTLSIQVDALQFQRSGRPAVEVKIASVQDVIVGDLSKQVGGLPMTLGKAAAPFGGGRAVSLFAHKKYDALTVQYVDVDGGIHGAIFQLHKGEGELFRNELVAKGVRVSQREDDATRQRTAEVSSESK